MHDKQVLVCTIRNNHAGDERKERYCIEPDGGQVTRSGYNLSVDSKCRFESWRTRAAAGQSKNKQEMKAGTRPVIRSAESVDVSRQIQF